MVRQCAAWRLVCTGSVGLFGVVGGATVRCDRREERGARALSATRGGPTAVGPARRRHPRGTCSPLGSREDPGLGLAAQRVASPRLSPNCGCARAPGPLRLRPSPSAPRSPGGTVGAPLVDRTRCLSRRTAGRCVEKAQRRADSGGALAAGCSEARTCRSHDKRSAVSSARATRGRGRGTQDGGTHRSRAGALNRVEHSQGRLSR